MWNNGFRQVTTSTGPVNMPEDMRGLKLRVPVSPLWMSTFSALGASAGRPQLRPALRSSQDPRTMDAQENSLAIIQTTKLYEVQGYLQHDQPYLGRLLAAGQRGQAMARLPKPVREHGAGRVRPVGDG